MLLIHTDATQLVKPTNKTNMIKKTMKQIKQKYDTNNPDDTGNDKQD